MANDIKLTNEKGYYDFAIEDGSIVTDDSLFTAIIFSLFTDKRESEQRIDPLKNRGWIIDIVKGTQAGSLLWLLDQARSTTENATLAATFAEDALQWMVDTGLALSVAFSGDVVRQGIILEGVIEVPRGPSLNLAVPLWEKTIAFTNSNA